MRRVLMMILLACAIAWDPTGATLAWADPASNSPSNDAVQSSSSSTSRKTSTLNGDTPSNANDAANANTPEPETPVYTGKIPPEYDPNAWDAATLSWGDPSYPYPVESPARAESANTYSIEAAPTKPVLMKIRMGFYDTTQDAVDIPNESLYIKGQVIPYVDWRTHNDAPEHNGGLWAGQEGVLDGYWSYYIGHNPGDFTPVYYLNEGDVVYVRDKKGYLGSYTVTKILEVNAGSQLGDLQYDILPLGEAAVFQTCINGGAQYRVVICEPPRPYVYQSE